MDIVLRLLEAGSVQKVETSIAWTFEDEPGPYQLSGRVHIRFWPNRKRGHVLYQG